MLQTTIEHQVSAAANSQSNWVWETPKEAGRRLRYSPSTLAKMRMRGDGPPYFKVNGRIRYRSDLSDAWAAAGARKSTSEGASPHAA